MYEIEKKFTWEPLGENSSPNVNIIFLINQISFESF